MQKKQKEKPLILIVDDTPTDIQVLAEILRADYRVREASSGKIAFEIIAEFDTPDLILLDVMMPEMDGYEICHRLKEAPEIKNVPVIFVTAKSDVVDEEYGLRLTVRSSRDYCRLSCYRLSLVLNICLSLPFLVLIFRVVKVKSSHNPWY